MTKELSRRDFLKLGSATLLGFFAAGLKYETASAFYGPIQGRVQATVLNVRDGPSFQNKKVRTMKRDDLVQILERVFGGAEEDYNRTWYRLVDQTYVYSGWVQEVRTINNPVFTDIPESGILGELTLPFADPVYGVNAIVSPGSRLYFGSNHWITSLVTDQRDGSLWYKAYDAATQNNYYVRPEWIHIFSPEEIKPLSAQVPEEEKQIEIHLNQQRLLAFESNIPVFSTRVATGRKNFESPTGLFRTFHKRPTYHMFGGADEFSIFDLPGVPWDTYITDSGVALHGTYWHNDFGTPHSHGCINMGIEEAKWIFRWTMPTVPVGERLVLQPGKGTRVKII